MKRLVFYIFLLLMTACEHTEVKADYVMHDYYYYTNDSKYYLSPYLDEHFIRFETQHTTDVIKELTNQGLQISEDPTISTYNFGDEYIIPDEIKYGSTISVKGRGQIDDIPNVIYSHHLYITESGEIFGRSNFITVYYDVERTDEQIKSILRHAESLKIHPISNDSTFGTLILACTNHSSGNPIEIANWFVEVGGFQATPDEGYSSEGTSSFN